MLSDALIWSDEFPDFAALRLVPGWDVIRFVFYFRTTVILGEPDENMREYWNEALQLFPDWPDFAAERQSTALHAVFRQKSAWARAEIEEIERETDREAGEQANQGFLRPCRSSHRISRAESVTLAGSPG